MTYPDFYDLAPKIVTRDPLAEFLGAAPEGRLEYAYLDAVKLAGHSCPTVASAWMMASRGLAALYPDRPVERGAIRVSMRGDVAEGVVGVIATVFGLVTGAADEAGFKGLMGRFSRANLLSFNAPIGGEVRFATQDRAVDVSFNHADVPSLTADLKMKLAAAMRPESTAEERRIFSDAFQERVRHILVERRDDPSLVSITRI